MKNPIHSLSSRWLWATAIVALLTLALVFRGAWWPSMDSWINQTLANSRPASPTASHADDHGTHDHGGHAHPHDESTSLELSESALRNLGLTSESIRPVQLETFRRSITIPATVVERPGQTRVQIATPMTGVVTHVHARQGEAIEPGSLLFRIRLTHEDLVQAQTNFLTTLGELDVERREIERLRDVTKSGAVAGRLLLEREYSRDRLEAMLKAQREALRLHGLSDKQVEQIGTDRRLLSELQIYAPSADGHPEDELRLISQAVPAVSRVPGEREFVAFDDQRDADVVILNELLVHKGQAVATGETLAILTDYSELYIEGLAFEQDSRSLTNAARQDWPVTAVFDEPGSRTRLVEGLEIAYLDNEVDEQSRTLRIFVRLPNQILREDTGPEGRRFVDWEYRPGQRLQLRIPVEEWTDQIVLPVDAVAREGAEYFVFQQNGNHFDRVPVHIAYRDQFSAVIANDGSLFPGDVVAQRGAHQMQMALKNKAGGGVDPHAGHNH